MTNLRTWFEVGSDGRYYYYLPNDDDSGGIVGFRKTTYTVSEMAGKAYVMVDRVRGAVGAISVDYTTNDGTGTAGVDYTTTTGTLTWAEGDTSSRIIAVPVTLTTATSNKTFTVILDSGDVTVNPDTTTVTIKRQSNGELDFVGTAYQVQDPVTGTTTLTLQVQRFYALKGAVGCSYHTTNGTALAGTDYNSATGTLSWADQEGGTKNIVVTILGRSGTQGSRNFTVTIDTATGGVSIGGSNVATATIVETAPSANPKAGGSIPDQLVDAVSESSRYMSATQIVEDPWMPAWSLQRLDDPYSPAYRRDMVFKGILSNKLGAFIGFDSGVEEPPPSPVGHQRTIVLRPRVRK